MSEAYSFIDIAVLDAVRTRFAAGDALAVLSSDLQTVLWANGAGAEIFGYPDIETVMGAPAQLGLVARRQIGSISGFPEIGSDRAILVRLSHGLASLAVPFLASALSLPDGERGILLALPAEAARGGDRQQTAGQALAGFSEAGYFAAIVGEAGGVVACTKGFDALGIERETLRGLAAEVRGGRDRLVKRLVPAGAALFPAGFARLVDDPARHLLVVVDEDQSTRSPQRPAASATLAAPLRQDNQRPSPAAPPGAPAADTSAMQIDRWYFHSGEPEALQDPAAAVAAERHAQLEVPQAKPEPAAEERPERPETQPQDSAPAPQAQPPVRPPTGPIRFVWRTDAEGRFSAISPDFTDAVGVHAADVIGRRFRDVANAFGFDRDGEIAGLLERRDTWSGRSVLWPVAGTDLRAPVDLAALPVYARDRSFEGFRGFGVARMSDALRDPEELGPPLAEVPPGEESEAPARTEAPAEEEPDAPAPADPFHGEVPALVIDNTPERRFTDKVIRLAERRQPATERGLTPVERNAFREIGDRLKREGATARPIPPAKPAEADKVPPLPLPPDRQEPAQDAARVESEEAEAALADEAIPEASAEQTSSAEARDDEPGADALDAPARGGEEDAPDQTGVADHSGTAAAQEQAAPATVEAPAAPSSLQDEVSAPPTETHLFDISILSRLPVPVLIHSGDKLHYANREFLDLTRYESLAALEQAGGLGALFVDPPEAGEQDSGDRKLRLRTREGESFPVEALLQSVPWGPGKALLLAIRPALRRVQADEVEAAEELRSRLAELRTILDTATDGVVLITPDGTIRSISRPAEALFGFDSKDVAGEPFASLFAVESQRAARDYLAGLSDNGVASVLNDGREVIGREAQGRFIPLFMTIGRLPGDSGYCAVLRDITQWKRAEEELTQARAQAERASSQKTDFLARVSHEIRTPLNAIIGFSELMVDEKFGPVGNDRYRDYLRDINRSGNHVLDLVNDLLDISKIEAGEQEMSYEAVSLNDALAESVAMMQPQANRERVIIRSSFASRLPEIVADMRSVRQIALNLLSNAIRYTPAGGQVIVSTAYEASGDIVMRVRDTGIGMTHAEIEQALKPFKQINALKRGRGDGTGLGLPLTKAMVEANRARFSINSTPGEGTMVEITFPSTRVLAD
jgi:PAS domain S-box-containing protein